MMTLAVFIGIWTTSCIQTQISGHNQGFAKETYTIEASGHFEFKRHWYKDSRCVEDNGFDSESGTIELGAKLSGLFVTGKSYEADFSTENGVDLGAISLLNNTKIKVSRGMVGSTMRNTMLGLFEFVKN